jgi:hypothetical protein
MRMMEMTNACLGIGTYESAGLDGRHNYFSF